MKIKNEFRNRLNKLYTHPLLGDKLDDGTIDFEILQFLEEIYKVSKERKHVINPNFSHYSREQIRSNPMFQAFLDLNILFKSKYFDIMHIEHGLYVDVLKQQIEEIKSEMSTRDKMAYKYFCRFNGITLGTQKSGFPYVLENVDFKRGSALWSKEEENWEFGELYYPQDTSLIDK